MKVTFISSRDDSFWDLIEKIVNTRAYDKKFNEFIELEEKLPMEHGAAFINGVVVTAKASDDFTVYLDAENFSEEND